MKKNIIKNTLLIALLLFSIIATGCQGASEEDAKQIAFEFLQQKVKFYSTDDNLTHNVPSATIEIIESYKEGDYWNFIVTVSSEFEGDVKTAKMKVVVDSIEKSVSSFDPQLE